MNMESNPLVSGIIQSAREKAAEILEKAKDEADSIIVDAEKRASDSVAAEEHSLSLRLEQIRLRKESAMKSMERASELRLLDASYGEVMEEVSARLEAKLEDRTTSRNILIDWIAEAALGLDRKEAKVSFSGKTPITEDMLREAEKKVNQLTGAVLSLSLDDQRLGNLGVCVSSIDGKVSYSNQLDVRIRRFQRDIKRIIQEENARQNSR